MALCRVVSMRIALGSDHAGFDLKTVLAKTLNDWGYDTLDLGTDNGTDSVDYPDFGATVGRSVASGDCDLGVAVCGTGIGISIAANKVPGVRAAVVHDVTTASLARQHNHANVVCFGGRTTGDSTAATTAGWRRWPNWSRRPPPRRLAPTPSPQEVPGESVPVRVSVRRLVGR